jgi:hypothetical protein
MFKGFIVFVFLALPLISFAQHQGHQMGSHDSMAKKSSQMMGPEDCDEMMVWDRTTAMCIALPMADMPMGMWMIHGNGFLVQDFQEGPRGRDRLSAPHMVMGQVGHSYGNHFLDVNFMLTFEKWTLPKEGYPELLQIGERNEDDQPYIDAQHPHSSPIMGLTFSDTIRIGEGRDYLKVFFAPRGQATEGPIAFMHRPTGQVNPDAPLGHHIGQDVSHITSTVLGASLNLGRFGMEASVFNGTEPEPAKVDLPLGTLNSYGTRLSYQFSEQTLAMISAAEVKDSEPHDPDLGKVWRYSGSLYSKYTVGESGWMFHNSIIYGHINNYDHISMLRSLTEEFWLHQSDIPHNYWGRIEFVERSASELAIVGVGNGNDPKWVTALTAGYTYKVKCKEFAELGMGASVTKDILPADFRSSYGGDPLTGKVFIQLSGMRMGSF